MKIKWKAKNLIFYTTTGLLWLASCVIIGISFYAMTITIDVPSFQANDPKAEMAFAITNAVESFGNVFNFIMPFMTAILGIMTVIILVSILLIGTILYLWKEDRKKMTTWKEVGFACERLEFLQASRVKINQTELLLNNSQYLTLQRLANSRMAGEALHGIELGDNATQVVKRLREELGSKLIEKTLIMNHRGKGYWVDIDPQNIKGTTSP